MKKNLSKILMVAIVFSVTFMGISLSQKTVKIAGEATNVTLLSLGIQAKAYCNEAKPNEGFNDGKCTGQHNKPESRCEPVLSGVPENCKRDVSF